MTILAETSWTPAAVEGLITSLVTAAVTIFGLWKSLQASKAAAVADTKADANTGRLDVHADHINALAMNQTPQAGKPVSLLPATPPQAPVIPAIQSPVPKWPTPPARNP